MLPTLLATLTQLDAEPLEITIEPAQSNQQVNGNLETMVVGETSILGQDIASTLPNNYVSCCGSCCCSCCSVSGSC